MPKSDKLYADLGLNAGASDTEVKKAFRKAASKHHPDKESGNEAQFKIVSEAYEILSDPEKKAKYDHEQQSHGFSGFGGSADDIFRNFTDQFRRQHQHQQQRQRVHLCSLSLAQAYTGVTMPTQFGNINIPKGVRNGTRFYVNEAKHMIEIHVAPDSRFKVNRDDLATVVDITSFEAMLGVEAEILHLDGTRYKVKIPAGIQSGQVVKMTGKGMPNPEIDRIGDLMIVANVSVPTNLTEAQKKVIQKMLLTPRKLEI